MKYKIILALMLLFALPFVSADLTDNNILYWDLDYNFGTIVEDRSGNQNIGIVSSPLLWTAEGRLNQGINFTSSGQNINAGNKEDLSFSISDSFSFSFWIRPKDSAQADSVFFSKFSNGGYRFGTTTVSGNAGYFYARFTSSSSGNLWVTINEDIRDDEWKHIVVTYDGSNSAAGIKFYYNAIEQTGNRNVFSTTFTGDMINSADFILSEGNYIGLIDEFAVYNKVLSLSDIQNLYASNQGFNPYGSFENEFHINGFDSFTNLPVSEISANFISDSENFLFNNETGNFLNVTQLPFSTYNITLFSSAQYFHVNINDFVWDGNYSAININFDLANEIFFTFRDEQTRQVVENATWTLINPDFAFEGNTTNGTGSYTSIPGGNYEIRYTAENYTDRSYFFQVPLVSPSLVDFSLYLLDEEVATTFIVNVLDQFNQPVQDIWVSLLRYYVQNQGLVYEVVEMMQPNFAGSAPFTAIANTVDYIFRVTTFDGQILFQGSSENADDFSPTKLIDLEQLIRITDEPSPYVSSSQINGLQYSLEYINTTNAFRLTYADTQGVISQVCLEVRLNDQSLFDSSCSSAGSAVLLALADSGVANTFTARAVATMSQDDSKITFATLVQQYSLFDGANVMGAMGVLLMILVLIVIGVAYASNPAMMIIFGALAVIAFGTQLLGFVAIGIIAQTTLLFVAIGMAYIMGGGR